MRRQTNDPRSVDTPRTPTEAETENKIAIIQLQQRIREAASWRQAQEQGAGSERLLRAGLGRLISIN
jgi:hypothetical protein